MLERYRIIFLLFFSFVSFIAEAQFNLFKKRSQVERATRKHEKRQKNTVQSNQFNPLQEMGGSRNYLRDDYIWSPETAKSSFLHAGNISVSTPSRWGVGKTLELQSLLGANYWVPNLFFKKNWHNKEWIWSSRHGVYSPTPGLKWAQKKGYQSIADSLAIIPQTISIKNELILSRPFFSILNCNATLPYLVLTGALAFDYGLSSSSPPLPNSSEHFIGTRHPVSTGSGWLASIRLQADALLQDDLYIRGHFTYFTGQMDYNALEHRTYIEYLLNNRLSLSAGYVMSVSKYASSTFGVFPFVDISIYFGSKPKRSAGLFKERMF